MPASLDLILTALQNGVNAMQTLNKTLSTVFPQSTATSSSVTAGTVVFSSSLAVGFMVVQTSSGATVKIPFYGQ